MYLLKFRISVSNIVFVMKVGHSLQNNCKSFLFFKYLFVFITSKKKVVGQKEMCHIFNHERTNLSMILCLPFPPGV